MVPDHHQRSWDRRQDRARQKWWNTTIHYT